MIRLGGVILGMLLLAGSVTAEEQPKHVEIRKIAEGAWLHISDHVFENGFRFTSNGMILRDGAGLMLIDTAWGEENTITLLALIQSEIGLPVTRAIVTHFHDDRVSGADYLETQGVEVLAFSRTRQLAAKAGSAVPDHELPMKDEVGATISVGPVAILYPGAGHAPDNIVIWVPTMGILAGGCMIKSADAPTLGYVGDADLGSWPAAIALIRQAFPDMKLVVPGHGAVGGVDLLSYTEDLLVQSRS